MERRTLFDSRTLPTGRKEQLQYYLLQSQQEGGPAVYGVEILLEGPATESSAYRDVTTIRSRIMEILHLLAKNTVTPVSLGYILEDLLG